METDDRETDDRDPMDYGKTSLKGLLLTFKILAL